MPNPLQVEVVAAEGKVWEGQALSLIARTTEGDIGILADHEPFMAALVPSAVQVTTPEGVDEIIAVSDGFISVFRNRVSLLSSFAELAQEISVDQARVTVANLHDRIDSSEASTDEAREYNRALAQLRAAGQYQAKMRGQSYSEITPQPAKIAPGD